MAKGDGAHVPDFGHPSRRPPPLAREAMARRLGIIEAELGWAYFDDETCGIEPIDNPLGPKGLPMSPE